LGSALGPTVVGLIVAHASIVWVFATFAAVAAFGAVVCWRFAIETRGGILEKLSP
jgi:putative MFS transporter